jgi:hypothetical protein
MYPESSRQDYIITNEKKRTLKTLTFIKDIPQISRMGKDT